ncbi:hypothetical protein ACTXT7_017583 [Hymenolepis weldensis]
MEEDLPKSSNKIRLHPIKLSKPTIGWIAENFAIMSHRTSYGCLLIHQTLILSITTCGTERRVVEKEVNEHPHNTKSSLMEAIAGGMEDINKDHFMKACSRIWTRIEWTIEAEGDI